MPTAEGRETAATRRAQGEGLTRRNLLAGTAAVVVAAAVPSAPAPLGAAPVPKPPLPTWIVGTPGEWDHEVVRAATREAAILFRCEECEFEGDADADPANGAGGPACECEACTARGGYEATRVESMDGKPLDAIGGGDWLDAEFCAACDRCGEETDFDCGGKNVRGKAVCEDCMTLADWDIVDPERAAELRAEAQDADPLPTGADAGEGRL